MISLSLLAIWKWLAFVVVFVCMRALARAKASLSGVRRSAVTGLLTAAMGLAGFTGVFAWVIAAKLGDAAGVTGSTPELTYHLVESDLPEKLSSLRGKTVLLNYWATW